MPDYRQKAEDALNHADYVTNVDHDCPDRADNVSAAIARAQVYATLAVAVALHETTLSVVMVTE